MTRNETLFSAKDFFEEIGFTFSNALGIDLLWSKTELDITENKRNVMTLTF